MPDFLISYKQTMGNEGGYVSDPDDAGGETYKGISRKYHKNWDGWDIIDALKSDSDFPSNLEDDSILQDKVHKFYKDYYWHANKLDSIISQVICNEMFDTAVNMGRGRAAKFLQQTLNYLNRNQKLFSDLIVDGKIGPSTLRAVDIILRESEEELMFKIMNVLQGMHYLEYMDKDPKQEKYARGWFKRVTFIKEVC